MLSYDEYLNENLSYREDGVVFILGKPDEKGKRKLYLGQVKGMAHLSRNRKGGKEGSPVNMVTLKDVLFIVRKDENGELVARKTFSGQETLSKYLGMNNRSLGLNPNKTPFYRDTLGITDPHRALRELKNGIREIPDLDL